MELATLSFYSRRLDDENSKDSGRIL